MHYLKPFLTYFVFFHISLLPCLACENLLTETALSRITAQSAVPDSNQFDTTVYEIYSDLRQQNQLGSFFRHMIEGTETGNIHKSILTKVIESLLDNGIDDIVPIIGQEIRNGLFDNSEQRIELLTGIIDLYQKSHHFNLVEQVLWALIDRTFDTLRFKPLNQLLMRFSGHLIGASLAITPHPFMDLISHATKNLRNKKKYHLIHEFEVLEAHRLAKQLNTWVEVVGLDFDTRTYKDWHPDLLNVVTLLNVKTYIPDIINDRNNSPAVKLAQLKLQSQIFPRLFILLADRRVPVLKRRRVAMLLFELEPFLDKKTNEIFNCPLPKVA